MTVEYEPIPHQKFDIGRTINPLLCDCEKCEFMSCPKKNYCVQTRIKEITPEAFYAAQAKSIRKHKGILNNFDILSDFFTVCVRSFPKGTYWNYNQYSETVELITFNRKGSEVVKGSISVRDYTVSDVDLSTKQEELANRIAARLKAVYRAYAAELLLDEKSPFGWLSPDGRFYGCKPTNHCNVAEMYLGTTETMLENKGWAKLADCGTVYSDGVCSGNPETHATVLHTECLTAEQRNWLSARGFILSDYD